MAAILTRISRRFFRTNPFILGVICVMLFFYIGKQLMDSQDLDISNRIELNRHRMLHSFREQGDKSANWTDSLINYNHNVPLIWVGGVPRSGTTLSRVLLDAHPAIRCGEETRVIPRILGIHSGIMKSQIESNRLLEAKITENVLDEAMGAYILSIIAGHGERADRLCNKDPFTLRSLPKIRKIFPNSQFILMLRDGRAVAHSIITRKVTIRGFDIKTYRGALQDWNKAISSMYTVCEEAGPQVCLPVKYEELVLHPEATMRQILSFLGEKWDPVVIHHTDFIGKTGGISLSKKELSTDQVNKPVNIKALTKWVGHIPGDVLDDMAELAPMLGKLGYDPKMNPPDYGKPDDWVKKASDKLDAEEKVREEEERLQLIAQGIDPEAAKMEKLSKEKSDWEQQLKLEADRKNLDVNKKDRDQRMVFPGNNHDANKPSI